MVYYGMLEWPKSSTNLTSSTIMSAECFIRPIWKSSSTQKLYPCVLNQPQLCLNQMLFIPLSLCILLLEKRSVSCTVYDSEILHLLSNLNIFNSGIFALFIFLIHVRLWINVALPSTTEVMLYLEVSFASQMFTIRCINPVPAILVKLWVFILQ